MIGAPADDRWGSTEYLLADLLDWTQYVFLISMAQATGKRPPDFKAAPRPTDAAAIERKRLAAIANQAHTTRVLEAMRTGDWTGLRTNPTNTEPG